MAGQEGPAGLQGGILPLQPWSGALLGVTQSLLQPSCTFLSRRTGAGGSQRPASLRTDAGEIMGPCQSGVRNPRENGVLGFSMNILSVSSAVTNTSLSWI